MCIYTVFNFVCGARKLKIVAPCSAFATNVQGLGFCRDDPVAHVGDGCNNARSFVKDTYGPGICSNVHCRLRRVATTYRAMNILTMRQAANSSDSFHQTSTNSAVRKILRKTTSHFACPTRRAWRGRIGGTAKCCQPTSSSRLWTQSTHSTATTSLPTPSTC